MQEAPTSSLSTGGSPQWRSDHLCFMTCWAVLAIFGAPFSLLTFTLPVIKIHKDLQSADWMKLQCVVLQKGIRADVACGSNDGPVMGYCPNGVTTTPSPAQQWSHSGRLLQNSSSSSSGLPDRRLSENRCFSPWFLVHFTDGQRHRTGCLYRWGISAQDDVDSTLGDAELVFDSTWADAWAMYESSSEGEKVPCYLSSRAPHLSMNSEGFPGCGINTYIGFIVCPIFFVCGLGILIPLCRKGVYLQAFQTCLGRSPAYEHVQLPQDAQDAQGP